MLASSGIVMLVDRLRARYSILVLAALSPLLGCASTPISSPRRGVAVLHSARAAAPLLRRACSGEQFCREDVVARDDAATIAELDEDCAHRGGKTSSGGCGREGAVASCRVGGDGALGTIAVFAYQAEDRSVVAEHCEALEGRFEVFDANARRGEL